MPNFTRIFRAAIVEQSKDRELFRLTYDKDAVKSTCKLMACLHFELNIIMTDQPEDLSRFCFAMLKNECKTEFPLRKNSKDTKFWHVNKV